MRFYLPWDFIENSVAKGRGAVCCDFVRRKRGYRGFRVRTFCHPSIVAALLTPSALLTDTMLAFYLESKFKARFARRNWSCMWALTHRKWMLRCRDFHVCPNLLGGSFHCVRGANGLIYFVILTRTNNNTRKDGLYCCCKCMPDIYLNKSDGFLTMRQYSDAKALCVPQPKMQPPLSSFRQLQDKVDETNWLWNDSTISSCKL